MNEERLWFLLARQLAHEASPGELKELESLLLEHPQQQYIADIIDKYFRSPFVDPAAIAGAPALSMQLEQLLQADANSLSAAEPDYHPGKSPLIPVRFIYYAAAMVVVSLSIWVVHRTTTAAAPPVHRLAKQSSEVVAGPGAKTHLLLPDGSQVWLNSGSTLHYENEFNVRSREVDLEGEGFFDVVRNADRPFIVHTSAINVKVLGTAFNIKSYPREGVIETTLLRGMVEISRKDDPAAPKVILHPNEKLVFNKARALMNADTGTERTSSSSPASDIAVIPLVRNIPDSDKVETSWMYNKLAFDGDSFPELAEKMERWYNIRIVFKSDRLLKYRFKGVFSGETIREALDALRLTARFSYKINQNEIDLYDD
ncbi:MAG TPA: FecR domain-containing protein [Puia sp.]|nr:FecR domain-containing protein [Puia sp.]